MYGSVPYVAAARRKKIQPSLKCPAERVAQLRALSQSTREPWPVYSICFCCSELWTRTLCFRAAELPYGRSAANGTRSIPSPYSKQLRLYRLIREGWFARCLQRGCNRRRSVVSSNCQLPASRTSRQDLGTTPSEHQSWFLQGRREAMLRRNPCRHVSPPRLSAEEVLRERASVISYRRFQRLQSENQRPGLDGFDS